MAAVGDGSGIGDRQPLRARASSYRARHAVPYDPRSQLGELIGRIAAAQHVKHRFECPRTEVAVGVGPTHDPGQIVHLPLLHRAHGDDLLSENVEWIAWNDGRLDSPLQHALDHGGCLEQVAAVVRHHYALRDISHRMAGAANPLNAGRHARWRLDLKHEVDGAHIDAQLQGGGRNQPAQRAGLELILDEQPLLAGNRAVVSSNEVFVRQLIDSCSQSLGQPPRVDEDDGRAVLLDELQQPWIDRRPDAA